MTKPETWNPEKFTVGFRVLGFQGFLWGSRVLGFRVLGLEG